MSILLVALVVVALLWFVFKPDWAPKPPDTAGWRSKASRVSKQATAKAGQMYQGLRGRFESRARQPQGRRGKPRRVARRPAPGRRGK